MERSLTTAVVVALTSILADAAYSQDCSACKSSNTLNISTGLYASGTLMANPGLMPGGHLSSPQTGNQIDPFWHLINVAPPSANNVGGISIPNAYTVHSGSFLSVNASGPASWVNIPGADALSVIPNSSFGVNNGVPNQPWRFVRKFYVCQADPGKTTTHVHFSIAHVGDDGDRVEIFDSNGALLWANPSPTTWYVKWDSFSPSDIDLNMHPGCCYMTVELKNIDYVMMGFSVRANLSVTNSSLSNPSEFCCATSTISVQKILDANCNGKFDNGELPGVGWTFNLLSGSSVIQTGNTDANGELSFYNVPNGTYTIQEVPQGGYGPGIPSGGQQTVVVSTANSVQTFQFLNCKSNASPTPSPTPSPSPTPTPTSTTTPPPCAQVTGD